MRYGCRLASGFATVVLVVLAGWSGPSSAQTQPAAAVAQVKPPGLQCNTAIPITGTDPFKGRLAGPDLPPGIIPVDPPTRSSILGSGLPCQEAVNTAGPEEAGLENLQRASIFIRGAPTSR
jgi:hypothetical protein